MDQFFSYIQSDHVDTSLLIKKALIFLGILLASYFIMQALGYFLRKIFKNEARASKVLRLTRTVVLLLNFILFLLIFFPDVRAIIVVVSILIAIIALATKDLIIDIVAYIYIITRKPFDIGQVIEVNEITGELIDIDFLQFNLLEMGDLTKAITHTGRYISLPNRYIFEYPVTNYNHTYKFVFVDVSIVIGFEADREKAIRTAGKVAYEKYLNIIENYEKEDVEAFIDSMESFGENAKPSIRAELHSLGFEIFIQFFTSYDEIAKNKMIMQNACYDEFEKEGIYMPVPKYLYTEN